MALLKISTTLAAITFLIHFAAGAPTSLHSPAKRKTGFNFGSDKVRGVDLGGWFVLEPWITPSLFEQTPDDVVDEWTMSEHYGKSEMESRMQQHWSTFITEGDFGEMAGAGLNMVRIPIGYWAISPIQGDPYVQGAYDYLAKAIDWAGANGLSVIIDLHGAPGSQNGFDNSGRLGPIEWMTGDTVAQTHQALNKIRDDHASNPAVAGIELVNEPEGPILGFGAVENFYTAGYNDLQGSNVVTVIHDAFETPNAWDGWGGGKSNVMIDTHYYQVFTSETLQFSTQDHITTACYFGPQLVTNVWTIVGEFTGAMTDCAKWLHGRNDGALYDGTMTDSYYIGSCDGLATGSVASMSEDYKNDVSQFVQAQMGSYEAGEGWIFWTWTTESAPEWDFKKLYEAGLIPNVNNIDRSLCGDIH